MPSPCFTTPLPLRPLLAAACAIRRVTPHPPPKRLPLRATAAAPAPSPPRTTRSTPPPPPKTPLFQCPVCKNAYPPVPPQQLAKLPATCSNCGSRAVQRSGYVDLTPTPSASPRLLRNLLTQRPNQSLFQLPIVSYLYERGWRDSFARAGFPGPDAELSLFLDFASPCATVLDLSCGSGLMSRRLASSGLFGRVVAADYSPAMLREAVTSARRDVTAPEFDAVRADAAALPFVDGAFDAVHCGAALHCWPNVQDGLKEVRRVLRPGGRFLATTFFKLAYVPRREVLAARPRVMKAAIRAEEVLLRPVDLPFRFFERDELEFLFKAAGFTDVSVEELKACAVVRCEKPGGEFASEGSD